jgi:hypothetical protein
MHRILVDRPLCIITELTVTTDNSERSHQHYVLLLALGHGSGTVSSFDSRARREDDDDVQSSQSFVFIARAPSYCRGLKALKDLQVL